MEKILPAFRKLFPFSNTRRIIDNKRFFTSNNSSNNNNNNNTNPPNKNGNDNHNGVEPESSGEAFDPFQHYHKLTPETAFKTIVNAPPKKFGYDFHLVQFFICCCMPCLAIYLIAQYSRSEQRKMTAEQAVKAKAEYEKANEIEIKAKEERDRESDAKLMEVKARLDRLEESIKEIAAQSKQKPIISSTTENQKEVAVKKQNDVPTADGNLLTKSQESRDKGHQEDQQK